MGKPRGSIHTAETHFNKPFVSRERKPEDRKTTLPPVERTKKVTDEEIAEALRNSGGIYTHAAKWLWDNKRLKISREQLGYRTKCSEELKKAAIEGRERIVDMAESALFKNGIEKEETSALKFILNNLGRDRGYGKEVSLQVGAAHLGQVTVEWKGNDSQ